MQEPIELDLNKMCRTCLNEQDDMTDLNIIIVIDNVQLSLKEIYLSCFKFSDNINMPLKLCSDCSILLINAYNFKMKCVKSEHYLNRLLKLSGLWLENSSTKARPSDSTPMDVEMTETIAAEKNVKLETISDDGLTMEDENEESDSLKTIDGSQKAYSGAHIPDDLNNRKCCQCGKTYEKRKALLKHLLHVHKVKFACSHCKNVFTEKKYLKMHMKYHVQFNCEICLIPFDTPIALGDHLNTKIHASLARPLHSFRPRLIDQDNPICLPNGSKEIECKLCSKQLNRLAELRLHLDEHRNPDTLKDCQFDDELLKMLGFRGFRETERQIIINQIVKCIDEGNLSRFYSITNIHGLEMSISDSETESEAENSSATHRLYTCEDCDESFNRRYKILEHQRDAHRFPRKGYRCDMCCMKFVAYNLLQKHLKSQCSNTNKIFTCSECSMIFMWHKNFLAHTSRHRAAKEIRENASIEENVEKVTENETAPEQSEDEPETDVEENETLGDSDKRTGRQKTVTKNSKGKIKCDQCDRTFQTAFNYGQHKQKHEREKYSGTCFHCKFHATNANALASHVRRHFDKRLYKCNVCGNAYLDASQLAIHMLRHKGEPSHKCEICENAFYDYASLFRHARVHEGEFKCQRCSSTFPRYDALIMHTQQNHEEFRRCGTCEKIFSHVMLLRRHLKVTGHRAASGASTDLASKQLNVLLNPQDNCGPNDALIEAAAGFIRKQMSN